MALQVLEELLEKRLLVEMSSISECLAMSMRRIGQSSEMVIMYAIY